MPLTQQDNLEDDEMAIPHKRITVSMPLTQQDNLEGFLIGEVYI